ncbi:shikimate dehydrogenase [Elioraea rosea]|uniref:shikimate dehydrogenase n=1 Tax=Elioraea rosea TaxID=2492390 RepID=UPI0011822141|nr:shikimate dehydrogenase [Elioraea rosea]
MTPVEPRVLSGTSKLAGIIGWPVKQSRSPRLHGFWLARHGIDGAYVPLPVAPENLATAVRALRDLGFRGGNVTIPHKESVVSVCDRLEPPARRAGAVNTLVFEDDGTIVGTNTDGLGFVSGLAQAVPDYAPADGPAVLLGAGGGARAVAAALLDAGCPEVILYNRTKARAEALAAALGKGATVGECGSNEGLARAALVVNTTSLGMSGQPPLELPLEALPPSAVVADIVYVPRTTRLLAAAAARGHRTMGGLAMLLHQAKLGFRSWFGVEPVVDEALERFVAGDIPER